MAEVAQNKSDKECIWPTGFSWAFALGAFRYQARSSTILRPSCVEAIGRYHSKRQADSFIDCTNVARKRLVR